MPTRPGAAEEIKIKCQLNYYHFRCNPGTGFSYSSSPPKEERIHADPTRGSRENRKVPSELAITSDVNLARVLLFFYAPEGKRVHSNSDRSNHYLRHLTNMALDFARPQTQ